MKRTFDPLTYKICQHPKAWVVWKIDKDHDRLDCCFCPTCHAMWTRWWNFEGEAETTASMLTGHLVGQNFVPIAS